MLPGVSSHEHDAEGHGRGFRGGVRHVVTLVAFALLAVLLTWPLAAHVGTSLPGTALDDNAQFLWNFWWVRQALADPAASVFATKAMFFPGGVDLVLHTHSLLNSMAGATIFGRLPLAMALNLTVLVACALNGFTTYLLAFRLTKSWLPSFTAGLFFAASPLFTVHLFGHFNYYTAWPLVAFVALWLYALERATWQASALAGVSLAVVAYTDYTYFVYALIFALIATAGTLLGIDLRSRQSLRTRTDTVLIALAAVAVGLSVLVAMSGGAVWHVGPLPVSLKSGINIRAVAAALVLWWIWRRRRWRATWCPPAPGLRRTGPGTLEWRRCLMMCGIAGVVAAALIAPVFYHAVTIWRAGQYVTQSYLWRSAPPGVDLGTLIAGNPFNALWGEWVRRIYDLRMIDSFNGPLWLGVVPLVLLMTRSQWMASRTARRWLLVTIVFLMWAVGPFLTVLGLNTGLPLPQILLRYVPIVSNARTPANALVMVCLGCALLLAMALTRVPVDAGSGSSRTRHVRSQLATAALLVLILIDFIAVPFPITTLEHPALYERLAALPAGAVLDVPTGIRDGFGAEGEFDASVLYFQTIHRHPIATGYVSRLPPNVRARYHASPAMQTLFQLSQSGVSASPMNASAARDELVRTWDVRFIVVHRSASVAVRMFVLDMGARMIDADDSRIVYEIQ
jgi:hypothetical protein